MLKDHEIVATASVGVALAPADGTDPERLLKSADLALYKSKADGRNCIQFFMPEMDAALQARMALEKTIRDAVLHERFVLHYQPVFEISDRHLTGFEALVRLPAADGSLIPPSDVHSSRGGHAPDRQDRRLGPARGLPRRRSLAGTR